MARSEGLMCSRADTLQFKLKQGNALPEVLVLNLVTSIVPPNARNVQGAWAGIAIAATWFQHYF